MSLFKRVFDDYFDERASEISRNGTIDSDSFDEFNDVTDPANPIWQGSEVHYGPHGVDPTLPDPNDVNQD